MTPYEIPLSAKAQQFRVTLSGVLYLFALYWNGINSTWNLNISQSNGTPLINGIPLLTGVNLLAQYGYMGFTGGLYVQTTGDVYAQPTETNLGSVSHLYYIAP